MDIKVREFELGDLPKLSRILRKMELKNSIQTLFAAPTKLKPGMSKEDIRKMQEELGADVVATALCNLDMAETELFDLIAGLVGKPVSEVKKFKFDDIKDLITGFSKSMPEVISFLKQAAR